jgi:hypothetical protein
MKVLDDAMAAGAETDDHPTAGEFIERGEMLRQGCWRARIAIDNASAELDA